MFYKKIKKQFANIQEIIRCRNGGVQKRIDENRELFELIQEKAPNFLREHPWVEGWIHAQDEFLVDIEKASGVDFTIYTRGTMFPRPWR